MPAVPLDLVLPRDAVRELDRRAIEELGVPSIVLMENAGRACAEEASALLGDASGEVVVACGPGNNGGDGFVVARTLANRGRAARCWFLGTEEKLREGSADAWTNAEAWRRMGGRTEYCGEGEEVPAGFREALAAAPLVVDALFGTGLSRPLRPAARALVEAVEAARRPVLAVDVPSGLDADTGEVLGACVTARTTVTFVARKPGFARGAGPGRCGRVVLAEIGIPRPLLVEAAERSAQSRG